MKTRIYINPAYADSVKALVNSLARKGVPPEAVCIYEGRNHLYKLTHNGLLLNIKSFRCPSFPNSYIYRNLRESKAKRSYLHALEMRSRGIPTPEPVAWIENSEHGKLTNSYYICMQSPLQRNMRQWEDWTDDERNHVLPAFARLMYRLHTAGILHHDLSPGNVLWDINPTTGEIEFDIVDLNRMTIFDHPVSERQAFSNFRNINIIEEEQTRRLGRLYGPLRGMDADLAGQMAIEVLRADLRRKHRLHSLKKLLPGHTHKH